MDQNNTTYELLNKVDSPKDIKSMGMDELRQLCSEIRQYMIECCSVNPGHLGSSLGAVELIVGLHYVYDAPEDKLVFDVGHQAYVHKIITGRRGEFDKLRIPGGLSGFTLRRESEHDPFGAGHSSTSVSASLGFAEADRLLSRESTTVCVIGDGAYTGGMVHEALNNCKPDLPLVIILNENGMSISLNKGTFASYLSRVRISRGYRRWKAGTNNFLSHIPLVGRPLRSLVSFTKETVKRLIYRPNYFEELGLYYIGPIDGNDYKKTRAALETAKSLGKTCVVHLKTTKGKGYTPAEDSPDGYHSVGTSGANSSYHEVLGETLLSLAEGDKSIVAVTAAMGMGTGLDAFGEKYPERYFDVGIAEPHALTFSAGLSAGGLSPFVAIYSTFLQRGYDSILHDIALQGLPVKLMIDRAGLSVGDGATHHGIYDVSFISHIPGMVLLAPFVYFSLSEMTAFAVDFDSPIAIRYPNAPENPAYVSRFKPYSSDMLSRVYTDFDPSEKKKHLYITYGKITENVISATEILRESGIDAGIILVETLKPYRNTARIIAELISDAHRVVYVEEGIKNGGAAEITRETLHSEGFDFSSTDFKILAIDDSFASPMTPTDLYDFVGLSPKKIAEAILK